MLEKDIHLMVCNYIRTKYPSVIFHTDFSSGMKMSIGMAKRNKSLQSHTAFPDLFIAEPRGGYCGMFIELKTMENKVYKKDGSLYSNQHHQQQAQMLSMLYARGYKAVFGQGYADTINKINEYFESN
jgi:hypothetical protein